ncbi:MAG: flagellar basal body-associated FliL family protein [Nitrospira sp.]
MTSRVGIALFLIIASVLLLVGYLGGISYSDLMPRTFSIRESPVEPQQKSSGLVINLPPIIAPVDDGQRFYYVQANLAVEIDRPATGTVIRDRHDTIDRHVMEMLHSYPIQDLRTPGRSVTLRDDLKRTVNNVLPKGHVRNVYITSWLITPIGY